MKSEKNKVWTFNEQIELEPCGEGVERKILSYTDALMCVENHFVKGLADHLGVSSVTLSVEFKNEMDISPFSYLSNLRIEKAKELLMETDMLVKEVRSAVGFCDERVFERRFKKNTGMTPGQYRKR